MENSKANNGIFGEYKPRLQLLVVLAIALLLGTLSLVFGEVGFFCGISILVISALIFITAHDVLPICGILLPAFLVLISTGELALPAVYIGFIFSAGVTAYLTLLKKIYVPIAAALAAYAVAAVILDPVTATVVTLPILLGLLAAVMLPRYDLSLTAGSMTILVCAGLIIAFLALGGDLAESADSIRAYIRAVYQSVNEYAYVIEEETIEILAAYLVNILPGLIFAAISVICYLSCAMTVSFLRASGLGGEIPDCMQTLTLSPVSGVIFLLCFFLSAAFSIEGGKFELAGAVTDNIVIGLALPFTAMGCRAVRNFLMNRVFASSLSRRKISAAAVALVFIFTGSIGFAVFISAGVAYSLIPLYKYLFHKIKSIINK